MVNENLINTTKVEKIIPSELSFDALKGAHELVNTTFREIEDGFECVNGDFLTIFKHNGIYKLNNDLPQNRQNFHNYVLEDTGKIFRNGTTDKKEIMDALRLMIIKTGNRIIK